MEFLYFAILLSLLGFWFFKLPGYKKKQKFFQLFKELTQEQRRSAINIADNKGNTAIHHAAAYNATAVLQFLIDEGADLEVKDNNGYTALHYAASFLNFKFNIVCVPTISFAVPSSISFFI